MAVNQVNLGQTGRDANNMITLQCNDINDEILDNAVFYHNGATLTDDPCFSGSMVSGGSITITIPPPCEGFFSCSNATGTVASLSVPIYGMWV